MMKIHHKNNHCLELAYIINIFNFVMVNKIDTYIISQVRVVNMGPFLVNVRYIRGKNWVNLSPLKGVKLDWVTQGCQNALYFAKFWYNGT
jgi:hypothetical protein